MLISRLRGLPPLPDGHDESGSLVVVLAILFVVGLLSTTAISRVLSDFNNNNHETYLEQARALAQSGTADALFQIDQNDGSPKNFCNAPVSDPFAPPDVPTKCSPLNGIPQAPGAEYTATWNSSNDSYTVLSRGTVHGVTYAVKAVIAADPTLKSALTGSTVTFNGNSIGSIDVTGPNGLPISGATADVAVASGGTITCHGGSANAVYLEYANSSTNCTPTQTESSSYLPHQPSYTCPSPSYAIAEPPTPCLPGDALPCNDLAPGFMGGDQINGYTVSGGTSTLPALLEPGVYVCYGGLTMNGIVNVNYSQPSASTGDRVEVYVFGPQNNPQSSSNLTLDTGVGTTINACEVGTPTPANAATNCVSGSNQVVGDPTDLQLYLYGGGNIEIGNSLNSINAILWAPLATMDTHGQAVNVTWTGSMVLGQLNTNGTPATFLLNYDERVATEFQDTVWDITSYLQTSPSFSIPNF